MSLRTALITASLLLVAACDRTASNTPGNPMRQAVPAAHVADDPLPPDFPPDSCTVDGYRAFFEAFVRTPSSRPALTSASARNARFDVALRDYDWVLASDPDTSLDIRETRTGSTFSVQARPVERDDDDEIVKVLGPGRTYRFVRDARCWSFAGVN